MTRVFVAAACIVLATTAHAVVLCARPKADGTFNTSIKIREACKPSETQLDPGTLGLQGPPGPAGADGEDGAPGPQGPQGGPALVVRDAIGNFVGHVVADYSPSVELAGFFVSEPGYLRDTYIVLRQVGSDLVKLYANKLTVTGFPPQNPVFSFYNQTIFYATSDCSGPPMVRSHVLGAGGPYMAAPTWSGPDGRLYYAASEAQVLPMSAIDCGTSVPPAPECCVAIPDPGQYYTWYVSEAASFDVNALGLVAPFHLEGLTAP